MAPPNVAATSGQSAGDGGQEDSGDVVPVGDGCRLEPEEHIAGHAASQATHHSGQEHSEEGDLPLACHVGGEHSRNRHRGDI
jgi:hypothetical protein